MFTRTSWKAPLFLVKTVALSMHVNSLTRRRPGQSSKIEEGSSEVWHGDNRSDNQPRQSAFGESRGHARPRLAWVLLYRIGRRVPLTWMMDGWALRAGEKECLERFLALPNVLSGSSSEERSRRLNEQRNQRQSS